MIVTMGNKGRVVMTVVEDDINWMCVRDKENENSHGTGMVGDRGVPAPIGLRSRGVRSGIELANPPLFASQVGLFHQHAAPSTECWSQPVHKHLMSSQENIYGR